MSRFRKPGLRDFAPYVPGFQPPAGEGWVKLNTNESPFPPSPRVAAAIAEAAARLNLYPDPEQRAFREAAAVAFGVAPEQCLAGNGGDELLAMAVRAFAGPGRRVAVLGPTYSLIPAILRIHDVEQEEHRFEPGHCIPPSFAASNAELKYLANPNSPTGTLLSLDDVLDLCLASTGVVLLDEAYVDFAPRNGLAILHEAPNLLLVRTMSKSFSLAGLRLGYALASPGLIEDLVAVKDSYNVGRLPLAAGVAALEDLAYRDGCVAEIVANRDRLTVELRARAWEVLDSAANFVWGHPGGAQEAGVSPVFEALFDRKVLIRRFPGGYRITVGTWDQCQALLDALDTIVG